MLETGTHSKHSSPRRPGWAEGHHSLQPALVADGPRLLSSILGLLPRVAPAEDHGGEAGGPPLRFFLWSSRASFYGAVHVLILVGVDGVHDGVEQRQQQEPLTCWTLQSQGSSGRRAAEPPGLASSTQRRPLERERKRKQQALRRQVNYLGFFSRPVFHQWHQGTWGFALDNCKANFQTSSTFETWALLEADYKPHAISPFPSAYPGALEAYTSLLHIEHNTDLFPCVLQITLEGCGSHYPHCAGEKIEAQFQSLCGGSLTHSICGEPCTLLFSNSDFPSVVLNK